MATGALSGRLCHCWNMPGPLCPQSTVALPAWPGDTPFSSRQPQLRDTVLRRQTTLWNERTEEWRRCVNSQGAPAHRVPPVWGPRAFSGRGPSVRPPEPGRWRGAWLPPRAVRRPGTGFECQALGAPGCAFEWTGHLPPDGTHPLHPRWPGAYLLSALVLAEVEDSGFELQLGHHLLFLGDGYHQRVDPVLQLVDFPVPGGGTSGALPTQRSSEPGRPAGIPRAKGL